MGLLTLEESCDDEDEDDEDEDDEGTYSGGLWCL